MNISTLRFMLISGVAGPVVWVVTIVILLITLLGLTMNLQVGPSWNSRCSSGLQTCPPATYTRRTAAADAATFSGMTVSIPLMTVGPYDNQVAMIIRQSY